MPAADLLAVFAHPDDESLLAGGTIAACAAAGLKVGIASLTRGELGPIATPGVAREQLGEERARELEAATRELGAAWSECLTLPDGDLQSAEASGEALAACRALVESTAPRALLTFGPEGLYWHPDHIATHRVVRAARPAGAEVYELTWPAGLVPRIHAELRRRRRDGDLWGIEPAAFGADPADIVAELDVTPFLACKLRALRCHRTQLHAGHLLEELPEDLVRELLGREWLCAPADHRWLTELVHSSGRERAGR